MGADTVVSAHVGSRRQGRRGDRVWMALSRFRAAPLVLFWVVIIALLALPVMLFLAVAFSPRLFDQGPEWFTLSAFQEAFSGTLLIGLVDSVVVGVISAVVAAVIAFSVAWLLVRTDVPLRQVWGGAMFGLLFAPSYLVALGWERLLEPRGVLDTAGIHLDAVRTVFYGPVGVAFVLAMKGLPFAYLAISSSLRALGEEYEAAIRVHGGGRLASLRVVIALLAPAIWSALAIVFAESVSDFGVAATLANDANFPVATYTLFNAVEAFPIQFPVAAAVGWVLMGLAGIALLAQSLALRGRSYRVLSGRSRPARRITLSPRAKTAAVGGLGLLLFAGLGVPAFAAVAASLIDNLGTLLGTHGLTLVNYKDVLTNGDVRYALIPPLLYSARAAAITATVTLAISAVVAGVLTRKGARVSARLLDLLLLTAVALPGIVFAAGYIFTYNLPLLSHFGLRLYGTTTLLVMGYVATALPPTSRVLVGTVGQVQESMSEAGRVHGSSAVEAWRRTVMPLLARPLITAWLLCFGTTLFELPVSELLLAPGHEPLSVAITHVLQGYWFAQGTAMEVIAVLVALAVVGIVWALFRVLAPQGWQRVGRASE